MTPPDSRPSKSDIAARLRAVGIDTEMLDNDLSAAQHAAGSMLEKTVAGVSDAVAPHNLLFAATRGYFLPSDVGFTSEKDTAQSSGLRALLAQSELVPRLGTQMWQLKPEVRRQVLLDASQSNTLRPVIDKPAEGDDPEGVMLRRVINGDLPKLEDASAPELDQLMVVSSWLAGTDLATVPSTADIRRQIAKRELLEPFRVLVGRSEQDGADGSKDRIVGREKQIEALRAYVGIVPPEELKQYVNRTFNSLWQKITFSDAANQPLIITGIGGMGKSSLIGKFVLDHALFPGVDLPFAYLDFDRAALAPRQPLQVLIDIALQFSTWFPALEVPLAKLRTDLRAAIDRLASDQSARSTEDETRSQLNAYCFLLKSIVESINRGRAPVLLVFDTFEVVQYDRQAVRGISDLIATLRAPVPPTGADAGEGWSNLRIVVAGRAGAPEIKAKHSIIKLGPLPLVATVELIRRRNERESLGLTNPQIAALAEPLRGSPLDVTIVMNWLKSRNQEERASLVSEIIREVKSSTIDSTEVQESTGGDDGVSSKELLVSRRITGILTNRMVNHINDLQVRKLVVPGLVVRAVTVDVILHVMAPASGLVENGGQLSLDEAKELLRRLGNERWLVTSRGECLRHRSDVRLAMLDLMRRDDRERFDNANMLAVKFFRERAHSSTDMRAETIYHLLLIRDERIIEEAESYWKPEVGTLLAGAVDDLTGLAQVYLKARLGRAVSLEELRKLPPKVASSLLVTSGSRLMQRRVVAELVPVLDDLQMLAYNPALTGVVCEAQYRSGRWQELRSWLGRHAMFEPLAPAFAALREGDFDTARAIDEAAGAPLRFCLRLGARDPTVIRSFLQFGLANWKVEPAQAKAGDLFWDYAACVASADGIDVDVLMPQRRRILAVVGAMCKSGTKLPAAATTSGALRVLAFHETDSAHPILRALDFNAFLSTVGGRELQEFGRLFDAVAPELQVSFPELVTDVRKLLKASSRFPGNAVIADPKFTGELATLVGQIAASGSEAAARCVLTMLAGTHPDWIEPAGNALTRAFSGEVPSKLGWWSSVDKFLANGGRQARSRQPLDGYAILSLANEAGSFVEALSAYAEIVDRHSDRAQDFIAITAAFHDWRRRLMALLTPVG